MLQSLAEETGLAMGALQQPTLATSRLRFLFVAAKMWRHASARA